MAKKAKDRSPYALRDIFDEMELELIESMQRNFAKHKRDERMAGFSWEMWQKAKLRNLQEYRKETTSVIYRFRKRITQTIERVLRDHFSVGEHKADIKLPRDGVNTGLPGKEPPKETQFFGMNKKKLDALVKSTTKDFDDAQQAVYRKMDDVYRQTIFKTDYQLASGAISHVFSHPSKEYIVRYKDKYKMLSDAIKAGLLHPNCRHTLATYFDGVTRLPEPQDNEKALENYNNEQHQRKLEREIRKRKRILEGTVDEDNRKTARKRLRIAQKEMRDFLEKHPEFKRQSRREKIYGTDSKISSKLQNFDESSLKDMDERTILEVDKALTKIYEDYPHMKGIVSEVKLVEKGTAVAELDINNQGIKISLCINKNLTPENASALTKRMYSQYKWTKKPGIEGIVRHEMGHVLNYDYYVQKNHLEYGKPYGDMPLQKLIDDLEKNELATELRKETLKRLGVADTDENVARYFSSYAKNKSMTNNGEFFAEAFSDYSDTQAKFIFMELLKERLK